MLSAIASTARAALLYLWSSRFTRNVTVVAGGTAAAQLVAIAFAPLLTRIYDPEAFGELGTFMALSAIAAPLAALTYPIAIVLPRSELDAQALSRLSFHLSIIISAVAALALLAAGEQLSFALGIEGLSDTVLLLPATMLFYAWTQIGQQRLIRQNQFRPIARAGILQSLITNSARAGAGLIYPSGITLIATATLGGALHAALLFLGAQKSPANPITRSKDDESATLTGIALRYRDFPLYRAPQDFINATSQGLPVLLLTTMFSPTAAGLYTLARMVMGMPSALLGKAVGDVFYPRVTAANHRGENVTPAIINTTLALLAAGLIPFGLIFVFGPRIFSATFGAQWVDAGEYARWLSLFFLFNLINKPAVAAAPALGLQRGLLIYEIFSTGLKALALFIGFYFFSSDIWAIGMFSSVGAAAYIALVIWVISHAKRHAKNEPTG